MSNTAEIYKFPASKAQEPPQAKRGPQVEDGYTRIANELFSALIQAPMTDRERRVALAVVRLTYGWNKKADRIADSQIADESGLQRKHVNEAKQKLLAKKVIKREGEGYGLLSINKHFDEWELSAKRTPSSKGDKMGDTVPPVGDKTCTPRGHTPKTKDSYSDTNVSVRTADADRSADEPKKKSSLPDCPHNEIIDLWAEVMPDKRQPAKNLWAGTARARNMSARWKAGFKIKHEVTGEPLYSTREEGIAWWGRFFGYLRRCEFLMKDNRWFDLPWVVKQENFVKILERKYEKGEQT